MSTTINTARNVTETVTQDVTRTVRTPVNVAVRPNKGRRGGAVITLNGQPAVVITADGFLSRVRGLKANSGVRRLDDGRIAMEPANRPASQPASQPSPAPASANRRWGC